MKPSGSGEENVIVYQCLLTALVFSAQVDGVLVYKVQNHRTANKPTNEFTHWGKKNGYVASKFVKL